MQTPLDFLNSIDLGGGPTQRPMMEVPKYLNNPGGTFTRHGMQFTENPAIINPQWLTSGGTGLVPRPGSDPGGGGGPTAWGISPQMLMQALQADSTAYQQAADEQFARNNAQIAAMQGDISTSLGDVYSGNAYNQQLLGGAAMDALALGDAQFGNIEGAARDARDRTYGLTDDIRGSVSDIQGRQSDMIDDVLGGAESNYNDVISDVNQSYGMMDDAADEYKQYLDEFEDRSTKDASAIASGIYQSGATQMQMAKSGMRPDGIPMSPGEQQQAIAQIQQNVGQQVQQQVTGLYSAYNQARLSGAQVLGQLRKDAAMSRQSGAQIKNQAQSNRLNAQSLGRQLAADMMQGEQIKLGAAQLDAQAGQAYADDVQAAEQARSQMFQLSTSLKSQMAQLGQAAMFKTADLRIQGRQAVASMVAANPRTVVGIFESLMSMYTAGRAQQQQQELASSAVPRVGSTGGGQQTQSFQHFGFDPFSMFGPMPSMMPGYAPEEAPLEPQGPPKPEPMRMAR